MIKREDFVFWILMIFMFGLLAGTILMGPLTIFRDIQEFEQIRQDTVMQQIKEIREEYNNFNSKAAPRMEKIEWQLESLYRMCSEK